MIDARDVLQNPERMLRLLCRAVGVEFDPAMLSWPPGLRETDGVWAKHWYGEVARSTSFQPYQAKSAPVPERLREIHERCRECYERALPAPAPLNKRNEESRNSGMGRMEVVLYILILLSYFPD